MQYGFLLNINAPLTMLSVLEIEIHTFYNAPVYITKIERNFKFMMMRVDRLIKNSLSFVCSIKVDNLKIKKKIKFHYSILCAIM